MKIYYYAQTGHRIGLDRFRRAAALIASLPELDITLLTSDFRIASVAKDFGVAKCVGIDVVRNIPQIAQKGDVLLLDSAETNPVMLADMQNYFAPLIRLSDMQGEQKNADEYLISLYEDGEGSCRDYAINPMFYDYKGARDISLTYFFGDDDYEKELEEHLDFVEGLDANLQLGFYYFLDYETMLQKRFVTTSEFEEYADTIKRSKVLLSASPQAILESLACGNKPIYFQRKGYTKAFIPLFKSLNIPVIENYDRAALEKTLLHINLHEYSESKQTNNKMANFIKQTLNL